MASNSWSRSPSPPEHSSELITPISNSLPSLDASISDFGSESDVEELEEVDVVEDKMTLPPVYKINQRTNRTSTMHRQKGPEKTQAEKELDKKIKSKQLDKMREKRRIERDHEREVLICFVLK
jgi:hypothetical protein